MLLLYNHLYASCFVSLVLAAQNFVLFSLPEAALEGEIWYYCLTFQTLLYSVSNNYFSDFTRQVFLWDHSHYITFSNMFLVSRKVLLSDIFH